MKEEQYSFIFVFQWKDTNGWRMIAFAMLMGLVTGVTGCGGTTPQPPNSVHVSGTVTFRGQPIKLGLIVFEPDSSQGASGAQGYANIEDGKFDTRETGGQAAAIGPCFVRITGGDGVGIDAFTPFGNLLFEEFTTKQIVGSDSGHLSIDVPASQGFSASEFR